MTEPPEEVEPPTEPQVEALPRVTSKFWIALQLMDASQYFPRLVEMAARAKSKEYTRDLLGYVAYSSEVTSAIPVYISPDGGTTSVDEAIERFMTEETPQGEPNPVDFVLDMVIARYTPPA